MFLRGTFGRVINDRKQEVRQWIVERIYGFNGWILSRDTAVPCPDGELGLLIIGIRLRIVAIFFLIGIMLLVWNLGTCIRYLQSWTHSGLVKPGLYYKS